MVKKLKRPYKYGSCKKSSKKKIQDKDQFPNDQPNHHLQNDQHLIHQEMAVQINPSQNRREPEKTQAQKLLECINSSQIFGREREISVIKKFLSLPYSKTLNIYGSPGLGKTCSVNKALTEVGQTEIIRINGLNFGGRSEIEIIEREVKVVIVDQFDKIQNQKRLIIQIRRILKSEKVILISNTNSNGLIYDVHEHVEHLPFMPYSFEQISTIISTKLSFFQICSFTQRMIKLMAKKVLKLNGDFRMVQRILQNIYHQVETSNSVLQIEEKDLTLRSFTSTDFLFHQTPYQNRILKIILNLQEQNLSKQKECKCSGVTVERLMKKHGEIVEEQLRYIMTEWKQGKILQVRRRYCEQHRKKSSHIKFLVDEKLIFNSLQQCEYFY